MKIPVRLRDFTLSRLTERIRTVWERRPVFNLNGTQWGELSGPIILDGDFEIEVTVSGIPEGTSSVAKVMFSILQANSSGKNIHIGRRDGDVFTFAFYSSDINVDLAGLIDWNKVNTFNCKYDHSTGEKVVFLNGSEVAREVQPKLGINWNLPVSTYFMKRLNDNNGITQGTLFSTKVWTNGDSTTGDLILDVPFNESGSDYQRNRAFVGSFVETNRNWYYQGELIGDSALIEIDFPSGDSGPAATASGAVFDPVKSYEVIYEVLSLSEGGSVRLNHGSNGVQDEPYNDIAGIKTAYVIANGSGNGTMQFYALAGTQASIRIISIREWSGVILHNALPEDWMQVEKKDTWDYWLEESTTIITTSDNLGISKNVIKVGDTYTRGNTTQSSYVGNDLIDAGDEGTLRVVKGQVKLSNLSESALYIPIRLQGAYPARVDATFNVDGSLRVEPVFISGTDIEIHKLSGSRIGGDLVIDFLVETSSRLNFYVSPRSEPTGDLDNSDTDPTISYDFKYISTIIRRKLEIAEQAVEAVEVPIEVSQVDMQFHSEAASDFEPVGFTVREPDNLAPLTWDMAPPPTNQIATAIATVLTGITEPVYFELSNRGSATNNQPKECATAFGIGTNIEEFLTSVQGQPSGYDNGGIFVDVSANSVVSAVTPEDGQFIRQAGDVDFYNRVGVAYDPTTGKILIYVFREDGSSLQNTPASNNTDTYVSQFLGRDYFIHSEWAELSALPITMFIAPDNTIAGDSYEGEIHTKSSDLLNPNGIPAGFTALDEVTGSATGVYVFNFSTTDPNESDDGTWDDESNWDDDTDWSEN
jgi:hypothetical protein